jgi:hypothetical protein
MDSAFAIGEAPARRHIAIDRRHGRVLGRLTISIRRSQREALRLGPLTVLLSSASTSQGKAIGRAPAYSRQALILHRLNAQRPPCATQV